MAKRALDLQRATAPRTQSRAFTSAPRAIKKLTISSRPFWAAMVKALRLACARRGETLRQARTLRVRRRRMRPFQARSAVI